MAALVLVIFAAVLLPIGALTPPPPPSPPLPPLPYWTSNTTINVCASSYTPMIYCDPDTDPKTWSGYEVELFRRVADKLNWPRDQINWKCMDWGNMEKTLFSANGKCDVALGLSIVGDYLDDGVVFSWPTYENGLIIAVNNEQQGASMWAFTDAFEWQVWVAVVATAIVVGIIIFGVDAWMYGAQYDQSAKKIFAGTNQGSQEKIAFSDYVWEAIMRPMQVRDQRPLSFASNFIVLAFAFMMLVVVTVYTANTTANITTTRLQSTIRGLQDLPGKSVGSWTDYKPDLSKYGVIATGLPWENDGDEAAMIDSLINGTFQALVLDESFLVYKAGSSCEIAIVGQKFQELNQAIAFPRGFNNTAVLDAVNEALVELKEEGTINLLRASYVDPPEASCKTSLIGDSSAKISLAQLSGLWILLACGVGIALIIAAVYKLHVRYTQEHLEKVSSQIKKTFGHAVRSFSGDRRKTAMEAKTATFKIRGEEESEMC